MAADMHPGDPVPLQSGQRRRQGTLRDPKYPLGQVKALLSTFSVGVNQNNPKIHWKTWGPLPQHRLKDKGTSLNPNDRQLKHRFILNHVHSPPAHRIRDPAHERQEIFLKRLQIFLLQSWLTNLHQKYQSQDPRLTSKWIQLRWFTKWT